MTNLSPAALAVWEAFNSEEPGVFVDYGDCLAAALRAAADQVAPVSTNRRQLDIRFRLLAIATNLETEVVSK
jgi:hypothetical protein